MNKLNPSTSIKNRFFDIKTIIILTLISICLLHLLSSIPSLYRSIEYYKQARQVNYLNDISDALFTAVANYGFERGRVNVVLNNAGPVEEMEKNRQFILARRSEGDTALLNAVGKLKSVHLENTDKHLELIHKLSKSIADLRSETAKDLVLPKEKRKRELPEVWFSAMTEYIESIEALLVVILSDISDADGMISRYSSLKHTTLALRNTSGPEMSILSATMLSEKPLQPKLAEKIRTLHISSIHHLKRLTFLSQNLSDPQIPQALEELKKVYFDDYVPYKEIVFPLALKGGPYPYTQTEFLSHGVRALKQIASFMDSIVEVTRNYEKTHVQEAKRQITIIILSSVGSLGFAILIFFYIFHRVLKPITKVTSVVRSLAQNDLSVEVPFLDEPFEIGEMSRAVEVFQAMALQLDADVKSLEIAEEKIRKSEERFKTVADYAYDWEYWISPEGQIEYMSPSCERITGYKPEDFIEDNNLLTSICLPEDQDIILSHIKSDNDESKPATSIDFRIYTKEGDIKWVNHICQPIVRSGGGFLGRRACNRDITERKLLEESLIKTKKLEATAILAGGIAHDFNNLLTAILGNIELAEYYLDEDTKAQKLLKNAQLASLRARDLTSKFITFSSGGSPIKKSTDINKFVVDNSALILTGTNIELDITLPSESWLVDIDKSQLSAAINNIIENAKEAMPDGGCLKFVIENLESKGHETALIPAPPENKYVKITFKDEGDGISPTDLPKVFDPYFSTKERGAEKGMGLGLTISHSIVEKHNGFISIESRRGNGTAVSLYLPASVQEVQEKVLSESSVITEIGTDKCKKILIMDDEEIVRDVVSQMLCRQGHNCYLSKDGSEATEKYLQEKSSGNPFDIVIMDLTIPGGMGGVKAVQEVLKIDSEAKVIVASGYSSDPVMKDYKKYGFYAAISKPFNSKELLDIIRTL